MEKKTPVDNQRTRYGSVVCAVNGSQIVFKNADNYEPFRPHVNYVVDTRHYPWANRRAKSTAVKKHPYSDTKLQEETKRRETALLKDVVVEVDREEKKSVAAQESPKGTTKSKSRWSVLRSVLRAVSLFRTNEAVIINNEVY